MSSTPTSGAPGWEFDEQAFLQKLPYRVTPTNLKGVYAGVAPPDDFDPNTASPSELIKNGILWRRPTDADSPALRAAWQKVFSRKWLAKDRIVPVLEPQVGKRHILRKPLKKVTDTNYLSGAWAGGFTSSGGPYSGIVAYWDVPTVSKASEPASSVGPYPYDSSSWIGIDGAGFTVVSDDVLQAGVQQYVDSLGNAHYVAWYEWYGPVGPPPAYVDQVNITSVPVSPGNQIYVSVQYVGKTAGSIYLGNITTGLHFSITLAPPSGATFSGNTVEWIMEDPDGGEDYGTSLAKFTPVVFTSAVACTAAGGTNNPSSDNTCNIETTGGKVLTKVALGNDTVTIDFIG
ncbi:MAG TPA: G1 family glutamic endopeptidase [Bryobacteraceae bacterium]